MQITRRALMQQSIAAAGLMAIGSCGGATRRRAELLVNHVGYAPDSGKFCMSAGDAATAFEIFSSSGNRVSEGRMEPVAGDFGTYRVGTFTSLREPGIYELRSAGLPSAKFQVHPRIYDEAINSCIGYFARQRCGDSKT